MLIVRLLQTQLGMAHKERSDFSQKKGDSLKLCHLGFGVPEMFCDEKKMKAVERNAYPLSICSISIKKKLMYMCAGCIYF